MPSPPHVDPEEVIHYFVDGGNSYEMDNQSFVETQVESGSDGDIHFVHFMPLNDEQHNSLANRFQ